MLFLLFLDRHLIRYYDHKLSSLVLPCPETPISNPARSTTTSDANNAEAETKARITASVSTAALSVLDTAFTLVLDELGTGRLHRLVVLLYSVVCDPKYRNPIPDSDGADAGDDLMNSAVDTEDSDSLNNSNLGISPAQALSALIKLIKVL